MSPTRETVADAMSDFIITLVFLAPVVLVYFAPSLLARSRGHPQLGPITIINLFFGWTLIGWVAALAWAVSAVKPEKPKQ